MRPVDRIRSFVSRKRGVDDGTAWIFAEDVESAVTLDECRELARLATGRKVLEIGSYLGRSTIAAASVASAVHSVDPHEGGPPDSPGTLEAFLTNLERYGVRENVVVHAGPSTDVVPELSEEFGLVFIDAMHQRPDVDSDFAVAAPRLVPEGIVAFHDYGVEGVPAWGMWHPFEVTEMVDELAACRGVELARVVGSLAVVQLDRAQGRTWTDVAAELPDPQTVRRTPVPSPLET